jgi:GT2 family glycosyltransferase
MLRWRSKWLPPSFSLAKPSDTSYKEVDSLNMNICCISKGLIDKLGFLGKHYHHSGADFDYGLRTKSIGYKVLLAPSTVGCCAENSFSGTSREKVLSPVVRIRRIFSIKEYPLLQTFVYFRSHGGYLWPFWLVIFYLSRFCHLQ